MVGEWGGPPTRLWLFSQKNGMKAKKEGEGESKRRWWLLSIISLAHSTDRGNSEALSFCWSIPSFWEDGQHNTLSISPSIYSFLSIFSLFFLSVRLSFVFYYVFSDNCFSLQIILEVKPFANEQIVIKSYKFLHYSPSKMESRAPFMACDKSEIRVGVLQVEGWGCVSSWWWCSPRAQRQRLIIHALRSQQ